MKAGDVVRCVDGYPPRGLHEGEEYTVTRVVAGYVELAGVDAAWSFSRFELVVPPVSEMDLRDALEEIQPLVISEAAGVLAEWLRGRGVEVEEAPSETVMVELPRSVVERCAESDGDRLVGQRIAAACAAALGEDRP